MSVTADKVRENNSNSKRYEYEDKNPLVYVIGQRPLDGKWADTGWSENTFRVTDSNLNLYHEGFISRETGKTLGFSDGDGGYYIGPDKERLLGKYRYGDVGYNGEIINEAEKIVEAKFIKREGELNELLKKATSKDLRVKIYNLILQNCQDFVDATLREGEALAKRKGVKFIIWDKREPTKSIPHL